MTPSSETYRRAFPNEDIPYISHGLSFPESCKKHAEETFKASRIYIIASKTLSSNTDALTRLKKALNDRVVGVRIGMTPHTLWSECLEVTAECRKLNVDLLITLGAGSLTDAAKIVSLVGLTALR
jgi:alcohol dehydrogenase class IV